MIVSVNHGSNNWTRRGFIRAAAACLAPVCSPGQSGSRQYHLREMDFHLHAGMERPVPLDEWIDLAVKDGRRVILLLDHLELYRKTAEEYEAWRSKGGFQARYAVGPRGHSELFRDFEQAAERHKDLIIFRGWEVFEGELDTGLDMAALRMADVVGWHISPRNGDKPPDGQTLLRRTRQIRKLQEQLPIPMILLHPFPMRMENLQRAAKARGGDARSITTEQYRFFQPGEQEELIGLLKGTQIYIEMSRDTENYFDDPACRAALVADILPLARGGVQFTISTDNHHLRAARKPFEPERYCGPVGITESNSNSIVRELLQRRAGARGSAKAAAKAGLYS